MMMSTPSPRLSREEELALWREKRKNKEKQSMSRTPQIRSGRRSGGSASRRRRSNLSTETSSASKTPYERRHSIVSTGEDSPFVAPPARLSSNVSCRKPRLPRRDLSTTSSKLKQKSLPNKVQTTKTRGESRTSFQPRKSLLAERYLTNRPSSLLSSAERSAQKENAGGSLVNQIRSRAAKKRDQDREDESSKPESRATSYRTPLSYGDSVATAREDTSPSARNPHNASNEKRLLDADGIHNISISLPFEDILSPLSIRSVAASPASTISSNEMVNHDGTLVVAAQTRRQQRTKTPVPGVPPGNEAAISGDLRPISSSNVKQDTTETALLLSPAPTALSGQGRQSIDDDTTDVSTKAARPTEATDDIHPANIGSLDETRAINDTLDFQGVEDDDSGLEESILDRRKRRRDSTFLRLPTPGPSVERQSISPDPVKSAFVKVERRGSFLPLGRESPLDHWSTSLLSPRGISPVATVASDEGTSTSGGDSHGPDTTTVHLSRDITRVKDRAILEAIPESKGGVSEASLPPVPSDFQRLDLENQALRVEANTLRIANSTLEKKLHTIRQAYDERVTPFRDVFEDVSAFMVCVCFRVSCVFYVLCSQSCLTLLQMRKLRLENQTMKKEKNETRKMVEDLKQQMMIGLQSAVDKTQALQKQLNEVTSQKENLERELLEIRQR